MAMTRIQLVSPADLPGKYVCSPAIFQDLVYGWPARITHATEKKLRYVQLPRGAWDDTEKQWSVGSELATPPQPAAVNSRTCHHTSVGVVCDTAEEAIALYTHALDAMKAIQQFRKSQMALLNTFIQAHEKSDHAVTA